jgi:polysaccharide biosynthesis transport protein
MESQQSYTTEVTRRPLDVEDYIDIYRRYKSWILGPLFAGLVIAVVGAYLWPDTYTSTATMQITPQQVPERLVPSNVNSQMGERLAQMQQVILSRASLGALIQQPALNLYPEERRGMALDDVVEIMRKDIKVALLDLPNPGGASPERRFGSAFQITFSYRDRHKAQATVAALVNRFMEHNVRVQRAQSNLTTTFLSDEVAAAKKDLDRLDREMTAFRVAHSGRLPEQLSSNLQALNAYQTQLGATTEAMNRAQQDKMMLETQLENYKNQENFYASGVFDTEAPVKNERLAMLNKTIFETEAQISALLETYTPNHPDIRGARARLQVLIKERDRMAAEEAKTAKDPRAANPQVAKSIEDIRGSMASIRSQIKARELEMQERARQAASLTRSIQAYQGRIEAAPLNEQKYAILIRDHALAKARYDGLMLKRSASETASNLEQRRAGENLDVLDPASLPETPAEPNRFFIASLGAGLGLMLGVVLAGAKEMKDTSLKNLKDVRAYSQLPVLASVPLLENAAAVRHTRRMVWAAWIFALLSGIAAMGFAINHYYSGKT